MKEHKDSLEGKEKCACWQTFSQWFSLHTFAVGDHKLQDYVAEYIIQCNQTPVSQAANSNSNSLTDTFNIIPYCILLWHTWDAFQLVHSYDCDELHVEENSSKNTTIIPCLYMVSRGILPLFCLFIFHPTKIYLRFFCQLCVSHLCESSFHSNPQVLLSLSS